MRSDADLGGGGQQNRDGSEQDARQALTAAVVLAKQVVQRAIWVFEDTQVFHPIDFSDISDVLKRGATLYRELHDENRGESSVAPRPGKGDENLAKAVVGAVFPAIARVEELATTARDEAGFPVIYAHASWAGGPSQQLWLDHQSLERALMSPIPLLPPERSPYEILRNIKDALGDIESRLAPDPLAMPSRLEDTRDVPPLNATDRAIAELVLKEGPLPGREIPGRLGSGLEVSAEHVRRIFSDKLKHYGFHNPRDGTGYHAPPERTWA